MIIIFLFEIIGELIGSFILNLSPKTKFEKNINRLKEETWFSSLEKDFRYEYIIYQNRRVKRFLRNDNKVKMIISMENEREKFIHLVKEEHEKFTKLH